MRSLIVLYDELLEVYENKKYSFVWVCNYIKHHFKNEEERKLIEDHFKKQRPSEENHQEFFNDPRFNKRQMSWWGRGERQVRIDFLKKIKKDLVE